MARDASTNGRAAYPLILFALLGAATSFEGFDTKLASLLLPQLGAEFDAGPEALGRVLSTLSLGTVAAFATIRLADRVGRRPVFLAALGGYSALTLATFFSRTLVEFAVLQLGARLLMVTQLALAYVILSEELPTRIRGRANGLLGAFASVGAALPAVFLAPLESSALGWRGLFLIGALPLLLWPFCWRAIRETPAFAERANRARSGSLLAAARALSRPLHRRRFAGVTLLWLGVNFWSACAMFFFTLYAFEERGWTARDLQLVVPAAVPFAFAGYALGGWLMDRVGRRAAASLFLVAGSLACTACYQSTGWWPIAASWVALQMLQGIWPIANTITAELFPTELRASASGLAHNLLGRWGLVVAPALLGALAARMESTGDAATLLGLSNLLVIPVVWLLLPETRDMALEGAPDAKETATQ